MAGEASTATDAERAAWYAEEAVKESSWEAALVAGTTEEFIKQWPESAEAEAYRRRDADDYDGTLVADSQGRTYAQYLAEMALFYRERAAAGAVQK